MAGWDEMLVALLVITVLAIGYGFLFDHPWQVMLLLSWFLHGWLLMLTLLGKLSKPPAYHLLTEAQRRHFRDVAFKVFVGVLIVDAALPLWWWGDLTEPFMLFLTGIFVFIQLLPGIQTVAGCNRLEPEMAPRWKAQYHLMSDDQKFGRPWRKGGPRTWWR
jgi:hypothetical protein